MDNEILAGSKSSMQPNIVEGARADGLPATKLVSLRAAKQSSESYLPSSKDGQQPSSSRERLVSEAVGALQLGGESPRICEEQLDIQHAQSREGSSTIGCYSVPAENKEVALKLCWKEKGLNPLYINAARNEEVKKENALKESVASIGKKLVADALKYFQERSFPSKRDISTDSITSCSEADLIPKMLESFPGIIFGEVHSRSGAREFLIKKLPDFVRQGVKTIYLEHIPSDLLQSDIDSYCASKECEMPRALQEYLSVVSKRGGNKKYNLLEVVRAARDAGLSIVAIDCTASYFIHDWSGGREDEQRIPVMNYFATKVIESRPGEKWVALVGNSHTNTIEGVPGLAELTGGLGVRVDEDVQETSIKSDPGELLSRAYIDHGGKQTAHVQADLLFKIRAPESILSKHGDFFISTERLEMLHHSRDGRIITTPIHKHNGKFYIENTKWPVVHGKRYGNLDELVKGLKHMGMNMLGADGLKITELSQEVASLGRPFVESTGASN